MTRRVVVAGFLAAGLFSAPGCEGGAGNVTGTVTYRGQPLSAGVVTFYGPDNRAVMAPIGRDGAYTAEKVGAGEVRVSVDVPQPPPPPKIPPAPGGPVDPRLGVKSVPIPRRYADPNTSGLTVTVRRGEQNFVIELKD